MSDGVSDGLGGSESESETDFEEDDGADRDIVGIGLDVVRRLLRVIDAISAVGVVVFVVDGMVVFDAVRENDRSSVDVSDPLADAEADGDLERTSEKDFESEWETIETENCGVYDSDDVCSGE